MASKLSGIGAGYIEPENQPKDDTGFFEPYGSFSKLLRTWLVSYGIGMIVFLISKENTVTILKTKSSESTDVFVILLSGVAVQVFAAFLYKYTMGYLYFGELEGDTYKQKRRYRIADWLSEAMFLEMIFDLATIALYIWATHKVINIILSPIQC